MNDDYDYDFEDEMFEFLPENMFNVLDNLKRCHELLEMCETDKLCKLYKKLFFIKDGYYEISMKHMQQLNSGMTDKITLDLVDKGLLSMSWDDETEEFTFKLTEEGERVNELNREGF